MIFDPEPGKITGLSLPIKCTGATHSVNLGLFVREKYVLHSSAFEKFEDAIERKRKSCQNSFNTF